MPELPEVEVLRSHLNERLPGLQVRSVTVLKPRVARPVTEAQLAQALVGATFRAVLRRGKHLVFRLNQPQGHDAWMHVHLGMTGRVRIDPAADALPRHAAVALALGPRDLRWVLVDPRQFGRVGLGQPHGLGPEPLDDTFLPEHLALALASSRQSIKARLLDQSVVAGIGNIYANEALHRAGVRPSRPAMDLRPAEIQRLHAAIRHVLAKAIAMGKAMELDFADGMDGLFYFGQAPDLASSESPVPSAVEAWGVYDRVGEACRRCGSLIQRSMLAGRATFHCPRCQR
ncbi:MAG: bifunctional DNA-formamidopyrimidine glycosylase/DNA-(apurinic or apyrimidinic site) lyase [Verrucomicrobiota bacterium]|jgi:formamidopyrimidine-DNA glycosylase